MILTEEFLKHHGVKGQKWGVRRYQKNDGSLTPLGKRRLDEWADDDEGLNQRGKAHVRSYDGNTAEDGYRVVSRWMRDYGQVPINRLRFMSDPHPTRERNNRTDGQDYDFDWHNTRTQDILDSIADYKLTQEWD